jgi:hypothetical protein
VADETGLRMRLSDRVIEDIAMRLGKSGHGFGAMPQRDDTNNLLAAVDPSSQAEELSYFIGENIDCWDIQQRGEFASFMADLPGRQGVRGFLKHLKGGGIIADTAGPLQVILAIGGTRAALATLERALIETSKISGSEIGCSASNAHLILSKCASLHLHDCG